MARVQGAGINDLPRGSIKDENTFLTGRINNTLLGASYEQGKDKWRARCRDPLKRYGYYIGLYDTKEDASNAWIERKTKYANDLADKYEDILPKYVIESLRVKFKVENI